MNQSRQSAFYCANNELNDKINMKETKVVNKYENIMELTPERVQLLAKGFVKEFVKANEVSNFFFPERNSSMQSICKISKRQIQDNPPSYQIELYMPLGNNAAKLHSFFKKNKVKTQYKHKYTASFGGFGNPVEISDLMQEGSSFELGVKYAFWTCTQEQLVNISKAMEERGIDYKLNTNYQNNHDQQRQVQQIQIEELSNNNKPNNSLLSHQQYNNPESIGKNIEQSFVQEYQKQQQSQHDSSNSLNQYQ